jgi:repressor LexA
MLTTQQQNAYQYIRHFILQHGHAPLLPEIAQGLGIRSKSHAHRYVQALVAAGLLKLIPGRHRGIQLTHNTAEQRHFWHLPMLGKIAAGHPIEAVADTQTIDLPALLAGPQRYILQVKGDSMIDEGIFDGDWVICERADTAPDGAIVVALIDNHEATLKRLKRSRNHTITLKPANAHLKPMVFDAQRVQIQGVFIGLVRLAK